MRVFFLFFPFALPGKLLDMVPLTRFITGVFLFGASLFAFSAEVFEVGESEFGLLPGGKEADGIVGDFILRNDRVEAVVSGNLPLRRPNMSAFYGEGNETPGCLYDLTLKDSDNDQITIFTPSTQKGPVNYVRRIEGLEEGLVGVETVRTAAKGGGVSRRHEYLLADGWQGVLILSEFENLGEKEEKLSLKDGWTQMRERGNVKGIQWADSIDPADKCGYAYAWVEEFGAELPKSDTITLRKGEKIRVARFLAVADSPAAAVGLVAQRRSPDAVGILELTLSDSEGRGIPSGRVGIKLGDAKPVFAYPNEEGTVSLFWPLGEHELSCEDMGRTTQVIDLAIEKGETTAKEVMLSAQSAVRFALTDGKGKTRPAKSSFMLGEGPLRSSWGPPIARMDVSTSGTPRRGAFAFPYLRANTES